MPDGTGGVARESMVPNNSEASLIDYDNIMRCADVNNTLSQRGMGMGVMRISPRLDREPSTAHAIGTAIQARRGSFKKRRNSNNGSVGNSPRRGEERPSEEVSPVARERVALTDAEEQNDIAAAIAASLADASVQAPQSAVLYGVEQEVVNVRNNADIQLENLSGINSMEHSSMVPRSNADVGEAKSYEVVQGIADQAESKVE